MTRHEPDPPEIRAAAIDPVMSLVDFSRKFFFDEVATITSTQFAMLARLAAAEEDAGINNRRCESLKIYRFHLRHDLPVLERPSLSRAIYMARRDRLLPWPARVPRKTKKAMRAWWRPLGRRERVRVHRFNRFRARASR